MQICCPTGANISYEKKSGELMLYRNNAVFSTAQLEMGNRYFGNAGI
jgi:hypothetical protein